MAKTIPQLTDATTVNAADELIIQQGGITKRATGAELAKSLNTINGIINAKTFGAIGDGVADDTAALQAAIAAASSGPLYIPPGIYRLTAPLELSVSGIRIIGGGPAATYLRKSSGDSTTFRVIADIDYFEISDLRVDHAMPATSGFMLQTEVSGILGGVIRNVVTAGVYGVAKNTITSGSVNNVTFTQCMFLQTVMYGIWLQFTTDWVIDNCIIEMASRNAGVIGLVVESSNDGLYTSKTLFLGGQRGMLAQNTLDAPSRHMFFNQTAWDGCGQNCIELTSLRRSRFVNCWFASVYSTCNGATINGSSNYGLIFSACIFLNLAGNGMAIENGASDVAVSACQFNEWGLAAANTYSAITTAANSDTRFSITGCQFLGDADFTGNPWRGIIVNAGTYDSYVIANNYSSQLTDAFIVDAGASSTALVVNNAGYVQTPSAFTAGSSPYTYTAGHSPEALYVYGGTVSAVELAGATVFTSTNRTLHLGPNQSVTITHSDAPTLLKMPQ
jgi:hypothetical protein